MQHGNILCNAHACGHVTGPNHQGHAVQLLAFGKEVKLIALCAAAM